MYGQCPVCGETYGTRAGIGYKSCKHMHIPNHELKLPKIEHSVMGTNLSTEQKVLYIKKRCLIAQFLDIGETAPEFFDAIRIIQDLNNKIKGIKN